MSVAVDVANGDGDDSSERDPYGEARIEVDEDEFRSVSPGVWLSNLSGRIDDVAQRLVWRQQ